MAATIHIHHRHLLLLLSPKADTHYTVSWRVEGYGNYFVLALFAVVVLGLVSRVVNVVRCSGFKSH